tara:strand:+ start:441 stop:569 length:129 start_codon:yes stop_codon:yes gene_type:complete
MTIAQTIKAVIASAAKQSSAPLAALDCRVAGAPRKDGTGENA